MTSLTLTANELTSLLLTTIPQCFPDARVWRVNVIAAHATRGIIRSGPAGLADISGIIGPHGRRLEIEVKAGRDRLRPRQQSFRDMILRHGGIYIVARDLDEALEELRKALS